MEREHRRETPETPRRSRRIGTDPDETFEFLSDPENLPLWWGNQEAADSPGAAGPHLDADPSARAIHLRWGSPGMWRHMVTTVENEGTGSRVTITFIPVPGCDGVCLDREILRARGQLQRLARILRARSHLVDSEGYWI
jgi:uncharacterized protein YndB with AHSA1/START domain